jgi:hypothetical protein
MFNFKEEEFFEIPETQRAVVGEAPRVDFGFRAEAAAPSAPPAPAMPGAADQGVPPPPPAPPG